MRQAFAGMLWSKQFYYYDVARWLDGDPAQPPPPPAAASWAATPLAELRRLRHHVDAGQVGVPLVRGLGPGLPLRALAHVDPAFAKYQLILLCREWFQHPNGALPAYEWDFGDVNPPVQAWAALEVFASTAAAISTSSAGSSTSCWSTSPGGSTGKTSGATTCSRAASSAWTTSARSTGPTCRPAHVLEQSDATGWMAFYALAWPPSPHPAGGNGRGRRRPGAQVPRALRRHPEALEARACGTTPTACSTTTWCLAGGDGRPGQGQVDGRHDPAARGRRRRPDMLAALALRFGKRSPLPAQAGADDAERRASGACSAAAPGPAAAAQRGRGGPARPLFARLFDEPSSCPRTACARCRPSPRSSVRARRRGHDRHHRLRAGRVDHAMFGGNSNWRGPDLVPAELPGDQLAGALPPVLRRRLHRRVPDRVRAAEEPGPSRRRPAGPAHLDLPARRRTGGGPASAGPASCSTTRPGGTIYFNEYFHGDNGAGLGEPPDRLDRADRRRDPPPPRRGKSPSMYPMTERLTSRATRE
jgi:hypothetical protein